MSVVFSAIASHSPLLIPGVGKENLKQFPQLRQAYGQLTKKLAAAGVETIIIFSPHGLIQPQAFTLNICQQFSGQFEEFGDFSDKFKLKGDIELAAKLKADLETKTNLQVISEEQLDFGSAVPLFLLTVSLSKVKIIPVYPSQQDLLAHYQFGQLFRRQLGMSQKKIAVVAAADLSHRLSAKSPAGYSSKAKGFDQKVLKLLQTNQAEELLKLDIKLITEVKEMGLRPIAMLLGVLADTKKTAKLLAYEHPFGIGCLVVDYLF